MKLIILSNIFSICLDQSEGKKNCLLLVSQMWWGKLNDASLKYCISCLIDFLLLWFISKFPFCLWHSLQYPIFPQICCYSCSSKPLIARSVCGSFRAPTNSVAEARSTSAGLSCQLLLRGFLFTQPACLWTSTAHTSSPHCPPAPLTARQEIPAPTKWLVLSLERNCTE